MYMYVLRRLGIALMVMLGTSLIVYLLLCAAGDPLADLRVSPDPNREQLIEARIELLNLDQPPIQRYFTWLTGALGCLVPGVQCNLGQTMAAEPVANALGEAIIQSVRLVTASTFLAMLIGITIGIITALRQYTSFDYGVTFTAFLMFSLPSFWVAVLMKEYGGIQFNNFLKDPTIGLVTSLIVGLLISLAVAGGVGGDMKRQAIITAIGTATIVAIMQVLSFTQWFTTPQLGVGALIVMGGGAAFMFTTILAGIRNKRALYSGLAMVGIGVALYWPIQFVLNQANFLIIVGLGIITVGVGLVVGQLFGGYDKGQNRAVAALTGVVVGFLIVVDKLMAYWPAYYNHGRIKGRPIATLGAKTPNFEGNFWMVSLDAFTHVLLPTLVLTLIGFATYARYSRAAMLEVMNQDYVRTARAKGLSERVVIVKHAFRNALVPIATIITMAIGTIVGGALITEQIFSWSGTGTMFVQGLTKVDLNQVMGVWLLTSGIGMMFIIIADVAYSFLDPRVRVK